VARSRRVERPRASDVANGSPHGEGHVVPPAGSKSHVLLATTMEAPMDKFATSVAKVNADANVTGTSVRPSLRPGGCARGPPGAAPPRPGTGGP
jgi:hypothetical protein